MPDLATLRLCSTLASTAFGFVFLVLWMRDRSAIHFGLWAASSLIYGLGMLFFSLLPTSSLLVVAPCYTLLAVSNVLPLCGVRAMEGRAAFHPWMILPIMSSTLGHVLPVWLADALLISSRHVFQTIGDAVGLSIGIGVPGAILAFGKGARASAGRRLAGIAMLSYLPAYILSILGEFLVLPGKDLVALTAMLSDQVLLGVLNLGLLGIPVERVQRQLRDIALKDTLTGCWNRAGLATLVPAYFVPGASVFAIDVDHFKQINDRHGHAAGDRVLAFIGLEAALLSHARGGQVVRQGGDEFVILLPAGSADPTRFALQIHDVLKAGAPLGTNWTVSLGCATVRQSDASMDEAFARADAELYHAKAARRPMRRYTDAAPACLSLAS